MTSAAQVLATLGTGPKYAVLDGARDKRITSLAQGELVRCLYRGTLPRELTDAAPHLMRLWPGNEPTERFFKQGWHESWGVLLAYTGPIKGLYRHLRQFLRVRGEDGRAFAFRWYDPRVLRVYLDACNAGELEQFFGPVTAFAVEAEERDRFLVFRRCSEGFEQLRYRNDVPYTMRRWARAEEPPPWRILPRLRERHLRPFRERDDELFASRMLGFLRKQHPEELRGLSHDQVRERTLMALARTRSYGLRGADALSFITMTFTVAARFDEHAAFRAVLADPHTPAEKKLPTLYRQASARDWSGARTLR